MLPTKRKAFLVPMVHPPRRAAAIPERVQAITFEWHTRLGMQPVVLVVRRPIH